MLLVDGGFNLEQTTPGQIAEFNMWGYEISPADLNTDLTCGSKGSVSSFATLQEQGSSTRSEQRFSGCSGKF